MPIKKRSTIPDPSLRADFSRRDNERDGRSPELQGQRYDVWQFIRDNGGCTRDDVARGLSMKSSTATARVKELIDLGYVVEPPGMRKRTRSDVMARCLVLSDRKPGGRVNERVRVEVTLTIDCNGVYGASARVVGGLMQSGKPSPILRKLITLIAPPIDSYEAYINPDTVAPVSRLQLQGEADQIIDADYEILDIE